MASVMAAVSASYSSSTNFLTVKQPSSSSPNSLLLLRRRPILIPNTSRSFSINAFGNADNAVTLLDYGAGNVRSSRNAIRVFDFDIKDVESPEDILNARRLVFPDVGAFAAAMDVLNRKGYRRYTSEEIEVATKQFSSKEKIGEGGYGPVYKGYLDHTAVAIKVLNSGITHGQKQFQREIEVLSQMRHPNMVRLLGACPEYGCLVYEYMDNGSLEDRLFCRNGSPPMPWKTRIRIAEEIATALLFLHQTKPEPLVHRDLKPANILLDRNYVSKIGDVGLSRLVPATVPDCVTQYHMTTAAGTFYYIEPEYLQTGMLGTISDIYSLGVMFLQMITGKPPMGLSYHVENAIQSDTFSQILDPKVTDWPLDEALSFAKLAVQCCEPRRKDRPDLGSVVLPELERLRDLGADSEAKGQMLGQTSPSASEI